MFAVRAWRAGPTVRSFDLVLGKSWSEYYKSTGLLTNRKHKRFTKEKHPADADNTLCSLFLDPSCCLSHFPFLSLLLSPQSQLHPHSSWFSLSSRPPNITHWPWPFTLSRVFSLASSSHDTRKTQTKCLWRQEGERERANNRASKKDAYLRTRQLIIT